MDMMKIGTQHLYATYVHDSLLFSQLDFMLHDLVNKAHRALA